MRSIIKLFYLPARDQYIVGRSDGTMGIATGAFFDAAAEEWLEGDLNVVVLEPGENITQYRIPIESDETTFMLGRIPVFDEERIKVERYVLDERYVLGAGYGPQTKTWVVQGPVVNAETGEEVSEPIERKGRDVG